jgi:hypothetical protein
MANLELVRKGLLAGRGTLRASDDVLTAKAS